MGEERHLKRGRNDAARQHVVRAERAHDIPLLPRDRPLAKAGGAQPRPDELGGDNGVRPLITSTASTPHLAAHMWSATT